jgi:hypothetical protein
VVVVVVVVVVAAVALVLWNFLFSVVYLNWAMEKGLWSTTKVQRSSCNLSFWIWTGADVLYFTETILQISNSAALRKINPLPR